MQGFTKQYYSLFLKAKKNYCEDRIHHELGFDPSNYEYIFDKIKNILSDANGIGIDSLRIRLQLTIEEKLSQNLSSEINESLSVFETICIATKGSFLSVSNYNEWVKAIEFSLLYRAHQKNKTHYQAPEECIHIAESILNLKNLGFKIQSLDGLIKEDDPELLRLATAIDYRVSRLGRNGLVLFNTVLAEQYSATDMRFYLCRRRNVLPTPQEPHPPYGYIFNLFCKYTDSKPKVKSNRSAKIVNEIQELSTHLATILDIDKMSPYANINVSHENILEKIREWVLYPEVFYVPQLSPNHGKIIFPRLFELIEGLPSECRKEIILITAVLQRIEDQLLQSRAISGHFSEQELITLCLNICSRQKLLEILDKTSTASNLINKCYKTPFDANKANIKETPLIKTNTGYFVANIAVYNIAMYRTLLNISVESYPKAELKLGFALEDFIKENFERSNMRFHHSFKYFVPKGISEAIQTKRHEGECDFIIESNEYIYLIEVKKKGLTKKSWSGDIVSLLTDTTLSFLRAINQLSIAELILLNKNKITSKAGVEISLKGRDIFKLVISFEDMASLQCDSIKNSLLTRLYNIKVNASHNTTGVIDKINDVLLEFTRVHNELSVTEKKYTHNPFHDISYISIPQLLTILDDTDSNEDFSQNIFRSNTIVFSLMDWYASYNLAKGNTLIEKHRSTFKKTTMIN